MTNTRNTSSPASSAHDTDTEATAPLPTPPRHVAPPEVAAGADAALAAGLAMADVAAIAGLPAPEPGYPDPSAYRVRWFPAGEMYGPPDAHGRRYSTEGWYIARWDDGEIEPHVRAAFGQLARAAARWQAADAEATPDQPADPPAPAAGDIDALVEVDEW